MDFERKTHKELTQIMKSKNLKYSSMMNKEEMKKLLEINEKNSEITVLPEVKTRVENRIKKEKEKPKKEIDIESFKKTDKKLSPEMREYYLNIIPRKARKIIKKTDIFQNSSMIDEKPKQPQKSTQNWFSKFLEDYARKQGMIEKTIQFGKDENIYSNLSYDKLLQMF